MDSRGHTSAALDDKPADSNVRTIGDVLKDIGATIREMVRSEIKLAKIEVADSARRMRSSSIMMAGGGLLGIYAIGFLLLAAMLALELVLPAWLAALIVGALLSIGAAIGISMGSRRLREVRAPHKTMQTVREDLQWMKEQARS